MNNEYESFDEWYGEHTALPGHRDYHNYVFAADAFGDPENFLGYREWLRENYGSNWMTDKKIVKR